MTGTSGVPERAAMTPTDPESAQPRPMPSAPPIKLSNADSVRNCNLISAFRAPNALRKPISCVRSETETSMIFMMPIPPTNSEIAAIPLKKKVSTLVIELAMERKSS